jgi:Sensors of blue-light using FAD
MYSVVYASSATLDFSRDDLIELLKVCRRNNEARQITGMLLYKSGNFIQVLEGEREAVRAIYERIQVDSRHRGVLRMLEQNIEDRQFSNWSMGFSSLDALPAALRDNFSTLLQQGRSVESYRDKPQLAWKLLLSFRDSIR